MGRMFFPIRAVPMKQWPESDRAAFTAALQPGSRFRVGGLGAHWRKQTAKNTAQGYGAYFGWLDSVGRLNPDQPPCSRVTLELVETYVEALEQHLAPASVAARIRNLGEAVRVMSPDVDFHWVQRIGIHLTTTGKASRLKADRVVYASALIAAGETLMDEAATLSLTPLEAARCFQDGMMIAFLARRPIRLGNLSSMDLDRHVSRRDDRTWVRFDATETKTHRVLEFVWPESLEAALENFLTRYRPVLAGTNPTRRLWMAKDKPLERQGCAQDIGKGTERLLGHTINPQPFRDCAATTIALVAPADIDIVRDILGHTSMVTSQQHYNQASTLQASQKFRPLVDAIAKLPKETM